MFVIIFSGRPPRRDDRERRGPPPSRRPPGFRVVVTGISRDTSWQVRNLVYLAFNDTNFDPCITGGELLFSLQCSVLLHKVLSLKDFSSLRGA